MTFSFCAGAMVCGLWFAGAVFAQSSEGIPVTDPLVVAKCGSCHPIDQRGNMQRVSWGRTTPEGWQAVLKRMILSNGLSLTPAEARSMVGYLSARHGLAPEEARPVMYEAERRVHDELIPSENLHDACTKCHAFGRALSWRRSAEEWKRLAESHAARYHVPVNQQAIAFLIQAAPLHTPEWDAWSARAREPDVAGRWLLTATLAGHGQYFGELEVQPAGGDDFTTSLHLTSVRDGSSIARSGRCAIYAGYSWRGRSQGGGSATAAPDDPLRPAREALWIAPDQSMAEGRWFWGEYQEFGFDVKLRRAASDSTLLMVDRRSLKTGSQANRIRLIGDHLPGSPAPSDLDFGPGVAVRRIVSSTSSDVIAEVDVASDAPLGKRDVALGHSRVREAIAIYDRVDYVKVAPDSAMAAFGDQAHPRGYQQFEAIGYQRGADGRLHTADDVELGPVDVAWSMEVFYHSEESNSDLVGQVSPTGFFAPAALNPNNNFDVWVNATARSEKDKNGKPLVGKSYLVVTVPTYTFNGRRFVRDLDRWVDDGPAAAR